MFVGGWASQQLWLFWVAPIAGAVLGALAYAAVGAGATATEAETAVRRAAAGAVKS